MKFEYKMIQESPNVVVKGNTGQEGALFLQEIVNAQAIEGWEFYRIDTIGVSQSAGCLGFGSNTPPIHYYVITFRRELKP